MTLRIESVLQAALKGLNLRQQVTADNIANADTPGFKARAVSFENQLSRALQDPSHANASQVLAAPQIEIAQGRVDKLDGNSVDLDQQLLGMTESTARFGAVSQALSQRLALYRAVISDGSG